MRRGLPGLETAIALGSAAGVGLSLAFRFAFHFSDAIVRVPLLATLALGGGPLLYTIARKMARRDLGSDLLAGLSIVVCLLLGEHLAGAIVVFMLSGGGALERLAVRRASSVLEALARRMPSVAHRKRDGNVRDVAVGEVAVGDEVVVFPHEAAPVDGTVLEGRGVMDESYLTGEPFMMSKAPGSNVLSGAVNGETALTIRAVRRAVDSRYARITRVMRETEEKRPALRRLGDRLGAFYIPLALGVAGAAWAVTGDPGRFLAVLVVATPCPLLIAIPVAIIGAVSLAAKRSIVIRDPAVLEQIETVRTIIFDKTGTLTYGRPALTGSVIAPGLDARWLLGLVAGVERYSKHPLAGAIVHAAALAGAAREEASEISETPGQGIRGKVAGHEVRITGRRGFPDLPPSESGLECVVGLDGRFAALYRFHDAPREESRPFVLHLGPRHAVARVLLVSGDRESEVAYLAREVGITEVHAGKSPEEKVAIVREETRRARTLFLGDGVNDAPALLAATVGVAFGRQSDVTAEAAGAVIMEASLQKVDEFFHIARRLRSIALQSAVGGMIRSAGGMVVAALGLLSPVAGAVSQEVIDLLAILNALRIALPPGKLSDF
jgi:heavy metal translocating P-type ATPase